MSWISRLPVRRKDSEFVFCNQCGKRILQEEAQAWGFGGFVVFVVGTIGRQVFHVTE